MIAPLSTKIGCALVGGMVLLAACAHQPDPADQKAAPTELSHGLREATRQLARAQTFSFGGVGYAGQISAWEESFFRIYRSPGAVGRFAEVHSGGTSEAKMYALAGLYELDRARFEALTKNPNKLPKRVSSMSGCIGFHRSGSDFVGRISDGGYSEYLSSAQAPN